MPAIPDIAWSRVAGFVRQHTHDLRNDLNGLDLEAALLSDLTNETEVRESVARLRGEIRRIATSLRALSSKFADPRPNPLRLPAAELFLIWQDQWRELPARPEVEWTGTLDREQVNADPVAVGAALRELLTNAQAFGTGSPLHAGARAEGGRVIFTLREPKAEAVDPAHWGRSPFISTQRSGYGLGLCNALAAIEASGGELVWRFDAPAMELVTTISFPVA
jgi:hypothetical protein